MFPRVFFLPLLLALIAVAAIAQDGSAERFDVWEYEVTGVSRLPDTVVEEAVYPYLGEGKSFADVEQARSHLEKAFRDAGYQTVLVSIPEQAVGSGVVRIEVTEAPLERVRVLGSRYYDQERILAEAPSLAEGSVPQFTAVQEDIARLNRTLGRRVTPVLKPGKRPGTTEIDLNVEDTAPWGGSLTLSNDHSPQTEPLRLSAALRYDNLFQRLHQLGLQYQVSPQDTSQVQALSASYLVPLSKPGAFFSVFAAHSKSGVAVLDTTNALGQGDVVGLRWIEPLPGTESLSHSVTLGADYKKFRDRLVQTGSEPIDTPIRYYPVSLSYGGVQRGGGVEWSYSLGATWGFRGLGSSERDFNNARFGASGNFFVLKWDLQRRHELGVWGQIQAQFDGQLADQPLLSNEQYAAGGLASVRGYLQAEALGDNALRGSLEWRTPQLAQSWAPRLDELRLYAFVEGARVTRKEPLPAETASQVLSSAGLGLHLRAGERLVTHLSVGWPFKDVGAGASPTTRAGKARVQFSTALGF